MRPTSSGTGSGNARSRSRALTRNHDLSRNSGLNRRGRSRKNRTPLGRPRIIRRRIDQKTTTKA